MEVCLCMRNQRRNASLAALVTLGAAAAFVARQKSTPQPSYRTLRADPPFELRQYPPLLVASVEQPGDRKDALNAGFRRLAAYIFADEDHEAIGMTAPVLSDVGEGTDSWRTRFIMPERYSRATLPEPPPGITIEEVPERQLAAVRFSGRAGNDTLAERRAQLRHWLERENLQPIGGFEYAFYDGPFIPPFLRRNEVLVPVWFD